MVTCSGFWRSAGQPSPAPPCDVPPAAGMTNTGSPLPEVLAATPHAVAPAPPLPNGPCVPPVPEPGDNGLLASGFAEQAYENPHARKAAHASDVRNVKVPSVIVASEW